MKTVETCHSNKPAQTTTANVQSTISPRSFVFNIRGTPRTDVDSPKWRNWSTNVSSDSDCCIIVDKQTCWHVRHAEQQINGAGRYHANRQPAGTCNWRINLSLVPGRCTCARCRYAHRLAAGASSAEGLQFHAPRCKTWIEIRTSGSYEIRQMQCALTFCLHSRHHIIMNLDHLTVA